VCSWLNLTYLGHWIDAQRPSSSGRESLSSLGTCKSLHSSHSGNGDALHKFLPNLLAPLQKLLKPNCKALLASSQVLVYFTPKLDVRLAYDSLRYPCNHSTSRSKGCIVRITRWSSGHYKNQILAHHLFQWCTLRWARLQRSLILVVQASTCPPVVLQLLKLDQLITCWPQSITTNYYVWQKANIWPLLIFTLIISATLLATQNCHTFAISWLNTLWKGAHFSLQICCFRIIKYKISLNFRSNYI